MLLPERLDRVLQGALDGKAPARDDCIYLLTFPSESLEAAMIRAVADTVSRRRFGNRAMLLGQIGVEIAPCPGNCKFCTFGEDHTTFGRARLTMDEIIARAHSFADGGDLYALFLMTMHDYAETGANPRDTAADTSGHRGLDMAACRKMLYEAAFTELQRGDGSAVPLDLRSLVSIAN